MSLARRLAGVACALLGLDLLLALVADASLLGVRVSAAGFLLRAAALAILLPLRFRTLAEPGRALTRGRLALLLLLLPTLAQFQYAGGRINGDGVMYYVYVRSLWKDFDLDLTNEYTHYELIRRSDLAVPTRTGLRRSIFAIGPAVIWSPFFWLGEGVARGQRLVTGEADLSGYGPCHRNAVALGSLLYGFLAVLLTHDLLRRHFRPGVALGAAVLIWLATFLHWYMVQQPTMSHAPSAFGAALVVWLWERERAGRDAWGFLKLGLALGLAMCLRWQNGVLLLLPGLELAGRLATGLRAARASSAPGAVAQLGRALARDAALLLGAAGIGAFPQLAAWKALYGEWLLRYPPHGTDFLRLDHPWPLETLFSSRHGLLAWTPVLWLAYLGFWPLLRRRPGLALPLIGPLLAMTYVNMCSGDWWAGGSFSNRRFDSLLPLLACGLAAALDGLQRRLRRAPAAAALALLALPLAAWNLLLVEQVRRGLVPRDDSVAFPALAGNAARLVSDAVGFPTTWPASWIFAWRHDRPPGQYDLLVGRYLFYRQNNLGGHVAVADAGGEALLGDGWGPIETVAGAAARRVRGASARVFAPLDVPEAIEIRFRCIGALGPRAVEVSVNRQLAGRVLAAPEWGEAALRVPAGFWRRELNEVDLAPEAGGVALQAVDFARVAGAPGEQRGFRAR